MDPGTILRPVAASTDINKVGRMDYGADELYMSLMRRIDSTKKIWLTP